jgi:hypothetical protein
MLANPQVGQLVRVRYGKKKSPHLMPFHDSLGIVAVVGKGKPRNHGVLIGGEIVIIPCGNLMKEVERGES